MAVIVDKSVTARLRGQQSAINRLRELVRLVDTGQAVPKTFLKPSGHGRQGRYEGYVTLGLWHAKLDGTGRNHGDPLLVLQRAANGDLVSVDLANHDEYARLEEDVCRAWLWARRDNIDWDVSPGARALFQSLTNEFDGPPSDAPGP